MPRESGIQGIEPTGDESLKSRAQDADDAEALSLLRSSDHPIVHSFPHGAVVVVDHDLRYLSVGGLGLAEVGLSREALEGKTIWEAFPPETAALIEPLYRAALAGESTTYDVPYAGRIFTQRLAPVVSRSGRVVAAMGFTQDVTEARVAEQQLRESTQRFRLAFEHAPIGMAIVGLDGTFTEVNPALCRLLDYSSERLRALTFQEITHPDDLEADLAQVAQLVDRLISSYSMEKRYYTAAGDLVWVLLTVSVVRGDDGEPLYFVAQIQDITDRKTRESAMAAANAAEAARLEHAATHDDLTGLPNRRLIEQQLSQLLSPDERRSGGGVAVLFCDLDGFKAINDDHGHKVGDNLLRDVAQRLSVAARSGDIIGRLGGDEFVVLMRTAADDDVPVVTAKLAKRICASLAVPFDGPGDILMGVSVSVGIALSEEGVGAVEILSRADAAMYLAKRAGKNGYAYDRTTSHRDFSPNGLPLRGATHHCGEVSSDSDAVSARDVRLAFSQAVVDLACSGVEAAGLLQAVLKTVLHLTGARAAGLYEQRDDAWSLTAVEGDQLPPSYRVGLGMEVELELATAPARLVVRGDGGFAPDEALLRQLAEVAANLIGRQRRLEALAASERHLVAAQRISHVGSYDFELATNTNVWSDELYRIYGREPQSFNASYEKFMEMLYPVDREHVAAIHQHSLKTLEPYEMEERIVWPNGQVRTLASWGEVVTDDDGNPTRMVGICWDISARREIEAQLVQQALHDHLTGLPNRALLTDRLTQMVAALQRDPGTLAVLFIDVDRFKIINDSLGHEAGDEVLVALSRRLVTATRPEDTVARFGADEFVVLCPGVDGLEEALDIASRLQEAVAHPMAVRGSEIVMSISTGVHTATSASARPSALLRDADAAMYRAKRDGRARTVVFDEAMRTEAIGRFDTEMELRRAIALDQLDVHYQVLVDIATGTVTGFEALARWHHPTRGPVPPTEFIAIAEETGLIVSLGAWVLDRACRQLSQWQHQHPDRHDLVMSVNLSGVQLRQPDLLDQVAAVLESTSIDPNNLTLEITESILMNDPVETLSVLRGLKQLGLKLSVDDFGTGYSSLAYLKRFPVDALKIDRTFVDGLGIDPDDSAIVAAVLALASSLGLTCIAEGIETQAQLSALAGLGCQKAQGFLLGRPAPAADLAPILDTGRVLLN